MAPLTLGIWGARARRTSRRTGREAGSETEGEVRGASRMCCHTGRCCWVAGSVLVEELLLFSVSLVSMTTLTRKLLTAEVAASAVGG